MYNQKAGDLECLDGDKHQSLSAMCVVHDCSQEMEFTCDSWVDVTVMQGIT